MKIYTKTGDLGQTSLIGGTRVPKDHIRIEAYGTVDELNSNLGLVWAYSSDENQKNLLLQIQSELFTIGSLLAATDDVKMQLPSLDQSAIEQLENAIDLMDNQVEPLKNFILPSGNVAIAQIHVARCVCRRAERKVVLLHHHETVNPMVISYLNRLSDYLFTLARLEAKLQGVTEVPWNPSGRS